MTREEDGWGSSPALGGGLPPLKHFQFRSLLPETFRPKVSMSEHPGLFYHHPTEVLTTGTAAGAGAG